MIPVDLSVEHTEIVRNIVSDLGPVRAIEFLIKEGVNHSFAKCLVRKIMRERVVR